MRDITTKPTTLRRATASATIDVTAEGVALVRDGKVEKGDVFECARVAALLAVKQTPMVLPHCHPIPILDTEVSFELGEADITIRATVTTIAATGVEMEALSAVSEAALCIYDMLKGHVGHALEVRGVKLVEKRGGKSQFGRSVDGATAAVLVLSDSVASGAKPDTAGRSVVTALEGAGFEVTSYEVLPDEPADLSARLEALLSTKPDVILTCGGTGVGPRDKTVETVAPMITTPLPGLMEAARSFGQARTPYAMLSRGVAGLVDSTVVITLPGSRGGAEETMSAILSGLVHLIEVLHVTRPHDGGYE
ncbi:MAG: bifunctional molybdenum cofactor biosynthesis protein MoaC/MoaB [Acidimicrobiales bacterium]|nr:bifunctional molybdenum cofactor biosynthesis protein MoaC/MoaB [Acidimicrobiales bacterium]